MAQNLQPRLSAMESNRRRQGMLLSVSRRPPQLLLPTWRRQHLHQQVYGRLRDPAVGGLPCTGASVPVCSPQPLLPLPYALHRRRLSVVAAAAARRTGIRAASGKSRREGADEGDVDKDEEHAGEGESASGASDGGGGSGNGDSAIGAAGHGGERIEDTELCDEVFNSYGAYATSVIISRAIPDARDGLKPVHRRILYAMYELGLTHNKPFKKCARVVGEVLGKFHPHGDTAVYDTLVRMAQGFAMRETLVDGHGNFGSLDNDPAAAMRYTECRLTAKAVDLLLGDLQPREAVDWRPTFDDSQEEPVVLPAVVPHLLVNGSSGIAVSLACSIPPHNLGEVVEAVRALIADPDISTEGLMAHVRGPDFPTGGELLVGPELLQAYETGRGSVVLRGKAAIERQGARRRGAATRWDEDDAGGGGSGREQVVITELPYQVFKSDLVASIAHLVESRQLEGVADVRDESDRTGVRVVVEIKRGASAELLLSQLFEMTKLETKINFNCTALQNSQPRPRPMGLKQMLQAWLDFRCEVVARRSRASLLAAQHRAHLVEGFLRLMREPGLRDAVLADVAGAADGPAARQALVAQRAFSVEQADAILDRRIRALTSMEVTKLIQELDELNETISRLEHILKDRTALLGVVEAEAVAVAQKYPEPRRTQLTLATDIATPTAAPPPARPCLLLASRRGFLRRHDGEALVAQKRNTRGKSGIRLRSGDSLAGAAAATDRDDLLLFTPGGKAYQTKVAAVPVAQGASSSSSAATSGLSGVSVANILKLDEYFQVAAMLPLPYSIKTAAADSPAETADVDAAAASGEGSDAESAAVQEMAEVETESVAGPSILLCSRWGQIKRVRVPSHKIRRAGLQMSVLLNDASSRGDPADPAAADELGWAVLSRSAKELVILVSESGQGLLMPVSDVRVMRGSAVGVKAMRMNSVKRPNDQIADMALLPAEMAPLLAHGKYGSIDADANAEDEQEEEEAEEADEAEEAEDSEGGGDTTDPHAHAAAAEGEEEGGVGEAAGLPARSVGPSLLLVTAHGNGKRIPLSQLSLGRRGQTGKKLVKLATDADARKNKKAAAAAGHGASGGRGADRVVAALFVQAGDEVVMASRNGVVVRQAVDGITARGRFTFATPVMALDDGDEVVDVVMAVGADDDAVQSDAPPPGAAVQSAPARKRGRKGAADAGADGASTSDEVKATTGRRHRLGTVAA